MVHVATDGTAGMQQVCIIDYDSESQTWIRTSELQLPIPSTMLMKIFAVALDNVGQQVAYTRTHARTHARGQARSSMHAYPLARTGGSWVRRQLPEDSLGTILRV